MYKSVLAALDLNDAEACTRILDKVTGLFAGRSCALHLFSALPYDEALGSARQFIPEGFVAGLRDEANQKLAALQTEVEAAGLACSTGTASGNAYVEILVEAERGAADLIVTGAGRAELQDYLLGPSAARIMRHAACSVLVVRP